jgi:hypothetical protein
MSKTFTDPHNPRNLFSLTFESVVIFWAAVLLGIARILFRFEVSDSLWESPDVIGITRSVPARPQKLLRIEGGIYFENPKFYENSSEFFVNG